MNNPHELLVKCPVGTLVFSTKHSKKEVEKRLEDLKILLNLFPERFEPYKPEAGPGYCMLIGDVTLVHEANHELNYFEEIKVGPTPVQYCCRFIAGINNENSSKDFTLYYEFATSQPWFIVKEFVEPTLLA
jgi:hypothetical protein